MNEIGKAGGFGKVLLLITTELLQTYVWCSCYVT